MKLRNPVLVNVGAWLVVSLFRLLWRTVRVRHRDSVRGLYCREPEGAFIYMVWHDVLLAPIFSDRLHGVSALISRHQDGGFLAAAMKLLRCRTVRGSSSRGGAQAIRELMDHAQHRHIVITPDGPRGPRHRMKAGAVYLASRTGRPIIPAACAVDRCWRIQGSWTDLMIPKPFARLVLRAAEPIEIPPEIDREQIDTYVRQLEQAMEQIQLECDRVLVGDETVGEQPQRKAA